MALVYIRVNKTFFNSNGVSTFDCPAAQAWPFTPYYTGSGLGQKGIQMEYVYGNMRVTGRSFAPGSFKTLKQDPVDGFYYNSVPKFRITIPKELRIALGYNFFAYTSFQVRMKEKNNPKSGSAVFCGEWMACELTYDSNAQKVTAELLPGQFITRADTDLVQVQGRRMTVAACRMAEQYCRDHMIPVMGLPAQIDKAFWHEPTDWRPYQNIGQESSVHNAVYMWIGRSVSTGCDYLYIGIAGARSGSTGSVAGRITDEQKKFRQEVAGDFQILVYRYSRLWNSVANAPHILKTVEMQTINEMNALFREAKGKRPDAVITPLFDGVWDGAGQRPLRLLNDYKRYLQF